MDYSDVDADDSDLQDISEESDSEHIWTITYPKMPITNSSKRIRKLWDEAQKHESNFHGKGQSRNALDLRYTVGPAAKWLGMQDYSKCTIDKVDYRKNDFVYIRPPGLKLDGDDDERKFWVARILEIRAIDARHVYALVAWMYWPDQLVNAHVGPETPQSLRRWYHGKYELVASNHLDVEDVTSIAGHATVAQWFEEDDDKVQEGLYWRQTFHVITGNLSDIRRHCVCEKFYNPDVVLVACPNEKCETWMHEECIVNDALTKAYNALPADPEEEKKKKPKKRAVKRPSVNKLSQDLSYKDAVYRKRLTGRTVDNGNNIRIIEIATQKISTEQLCCLKCNTALE
ncbi:hypothetical protein V493_01209 [Pseudogymnoascus sp. VKM F-4281 (FW-2241)]|nr:hypothetical protein V493_01209 [Pseudogymnoascus sp. VKM F-4281 (FW-2241)]